MLKFAVKFYFVSNLVMGDFNSCSSIIVLHDNFLFFSCCLGYHGYCQMCKNGPGCDYMYMHAFVRVFGCFFLCFFFFENSSCYL